MKTMTKFTFIALSILTVSCAGPSFNNQIEKDKYDLLAEESFMRYNSNRLNAIDSTKRDFIAQALIA
ncbi:MAG: hypothetical protein K2Q18_11185, partial [Bdellovibrionales bacterium]|nr:hypothetical protein [Bdellovibrionales bacterium]